MKLHRTGTLALTGVAIVAAISTGTFAAWAASEDIGSATLRLGTLNLQPITDPNGLVGPVWSDISDPDAPVTIDPTTFLASAGDTLSQSQHFRLDAGGDNLEYDFTMDWAQAPALTDNVSGNYSLIADPGTASETVLVNKKPLGTDASLPIARAGQRSFRLDIVVTYGTGGTGVPIGTATPIYAGEIVLSANQIREGVQ